jgi:hypothetical protein
LYLLKDDSAVFYGEEFSDMNMIEETTESLNLASSSKLSKSVGKGQPSFQTIVTNQRQQKLAQGFEEIKRHRWFISIGNWNDVLEKRLKPPFRPELMHDGDTRNFEKYETPDFSQIDGVSDKQLEIFCNF